MFEYFHQNDRIDSKSKDCIFKDTVYFQSQDLFSAQTILYGPYMVQFTLYSTYMFGPKPYIFRQVEIRSNLREKIKFIFIRHLVVEYRRTRNVLLLNPYLRHPKIKIGILMYLRIFVHDSWIGVNRTCAFQPDGFELTAAELFNQLV